MTVSWDHTVDVVAIGSGGGGLLAGIAAREAGGQALVIEKRDLLGGSTAMSGGVVWLPNNPLMQRDGIADSDELGMEYFGATVGDVGAASSDERRRAFLTEGQAMIRMLMRKGARLVRCPGYSDYYSNNLGGNAAGRSMEPAAFDGSELGEWLPLIQSGLAKGVGMNVMTNELRDLQYFNRSLKSLRIAARVQLRTWRAQLLRRPVLTNGTALVARLVQAAVASGVELWTGAAFDDFVVEDGRVVGVRVIRDGRVLLVQARRGVVVAAGGFARNAEMREEFGGTQRTDPAWSSSNPGDTGDALRAAIKLGAETDLMDEAWWLPGPSPAFGMSTLTAARNRPNTIMVDAAGRRFVNESNSYVEVGKAMFARNRTSTAVPAWLVFDEHYRRRYAHRRSLLVGRLPKEWLSSGLLVQASSLEELASKCGIDPAGLADQVARWNRHAEQGRDPEFGRGTSAYNDCLGDPGPGVPNPAVGPIDKPPYYAFQLFPGDVGTCGGVLTDAQARVLGADGPIPGLYATGNGTATVMGRHYLGAGASIAYSMIFGYIGARHAMAQVPAVVA
ncbi:FAD-binding protein [Nakamurella sp. YIM 132087]|uniref:FAD-binding protein n=1 Tax=Nakamurella alba TaxID=2665158 RepID=A0A7K1FM46_9ACTN|nr:FAD-binding protein [Nakamurella alba]MTD15188.1 FAD-binding protein [Nakamurella alba]